MCGCLRRPSRPWSGFLLDVSKAHKRVKIAAAEQGYSLFAVCDELGKTHWMCYKTCHFGCSWASYWWARTAGTFLRLAHRLLQERWTLGMYLDMVDLRGQ